MATFIEITRLDGSKGAVNVDQIVSVWRKTDNNRDQFPPGMNTGITTIVAKGLSALHAAEHYPAVMALIARAGAKVVR